MPKYDLLSLRVGADSFLASLFNEILGAIGFLVAFFLALGLLLRDALLSFCPLKGIILTGSVRAFFFRAPL